MSDPNQQNPVPVSRMEPPVLTPEQEDLCARLDELHAKNGLGSKPSDMFRGALVAAYPEMQKVNLDWAAQAAHSLREILYTFNSKVKGEVGIEAAFEKAGAVRIAEEKKELYTIYNQITDLAHHRHPANDGSGLGKFDEADFRAMLDSFMRAAARALSRQLDVHEDVDTFVSQWSIEAGDQK